LSTRNGIENSKGKKYKKDPVESPSTNAIRTRKKFRSKTVPTLVHVKYPCMFIHNNIHKVAVSPATIAEDKKLP
jgi:hypothetical protein